MPGWNASVSSNVFGFSGSLTGELGPVMPGGVPDAETKQDHNYWCDEPVDEITEETVSESVEVIDRGLYIATTIFGDITDYTRPGPGATTIPFIIDWVNGGDGSGEPPVVDFDDGRLLCREASLDVFGSEDNASPLLTEILDSHIEIISTTVFTRMGSTGTYLNIPRIKRTQPAFQAENAILEIVVSLDGMEGGSQLGWSITFGEGADSYSLELDPDPEEAPVPAATVTFRMNLTTKEVEVIQS